MFDRFISVDWSGAGRETDGVDLRIAVYDVTTEQSVIVDRPYQNRTVSSWSRQAFRKWIAEQLQGNRPTLVAMDFGFGLPWGADQALFGVTGWRETIRKLAEEYESKGTARTTAQGINSQAKFGGHGPYRFDDGRNDFRFYLDTGVAYYRLTELIAPQGISQWYLGSGGTVGFHTISGLATIDHLIRKREAGELDFVIWPHESQLPDGTRHTLVESYPAICPCPDDYGACRPNDPNQRDAWKVLEYLRNKRNEGSLNGLFQIKEQPFGRIIGIEFMTQIQFEGYIFGLT